jgi:hypothetical protein
MTAKKAAVVTISRVASSMRTSFQKTRAEARTNPGAAEGTAAEGAAVEEGGAAKS